MAVHDRDQPYGTLQSLAAAAAPATGDSLHFVEEMPVAVSILVQKTATPTFSVSLEGSFDGVTWTPIGSAITATGFVTTTSVAPYYRANLTSISGGGTVSAYIGAGGQTTGQFTPGPKGAQGDSGGAVLGSGVDETNSEPVSGILLDGAPHAVVPTVSLLLPWIDGTGHIILPGLYFVVCIVSPDVAVTAPCNIRVDGGFNGFLDVFPSSALALGQPRFSDIAAIGNADLPFPISFEVISDQSDLTGAIALSYQVYRLAY